MAEDKPVAGTPVDPCILSGKRRAPRRRCTLAVEVRGAGGRVYAARTVDVSRGGMLLEFTDPQLRVPSQHQDLLRFASQVGALFPTGMEVSFGEGAVRSHAKPVRLVSGAGGASTHLLGCRFRRPLDTVDCRLLGVETSGDETDDAAENGPPSGSPAGASVAPGPNDDVLAILDEAEREASGAASVPSSIPVPTPSAVPPAEAPPAPASTPTAVGSVPPRPSPHAGLSDEDLRGLNRREGAVRGGTGTPASPVWAPDGTVVAHLFPTSQLLVGPRFTGRALELRTRGVVVELAAPAGERDAVGWAAGLGADVRAVFLRGGRVLWETRARVQRIADATAGVVRATLLAETPPPPAARRAFGPTGADTDRAEASSGARGGRLLI